LSSICGITASFDSELSGFEMSIGNPMEIFSMFDTIGPVAQKKGGKSKTERPVFDSIRKPTAPPSRQIESEAKIEKHLPSLRKVKHKKPPEAED
jgi:hypothetical protein